MNEPLDELSQRIRRMLNKGRTSEVDEMLSTIYTSGLAPMTMVRVLMVTFPTKDLLPSRPALYARVMAALLERANFEEQLLEGLA